MASCDGCGKKIGLFDSSNGYQDRLFCIRCYGNIPVKKNEDEVDQILEQQKDNAESFESIAFLGRLILRLGGAVAILGSIAAIFVGEAIFIAPVIATLVFSLIFGAVLLSLGLIGLELGAIRKSLSKSAKSSSDTK